MATPILQAARSASFSKRALDSSSVRVVERAIAGLAFVAVFPAIATGALVVRALSGRSPFIAHQRVGQAGEPLWMWKLRTMWGAEHHSSTGGWVEYLPDTYVPITKGQPDPRVTSRVAAWMRRYSIDELPQLWHVATGRMRFVGPRPLTRRELDTYYGHHAANVVLSVPPGLTGLWQILGRNRLTYRQRRRLDVFFVTHANTRLCARILLRTPLRVFSGRDAW